MGRPRSRSRRPRRARSRSSRGRAGPSASGSSSRSPRAPDRRLGQVALDPDPQVGVAQPDPIAGAWGHGAARARRGSIGRARARRPPAVRDQVDLLRLSRGPAQRVARRQVQAEPVRRSRSNVRCSFARQNGKCDETRTGRSPTCSSRSGGSVPLRDERDVAVGEPDRAGSRRRPPGPNGSRSTKSRDPSSSRTSSRISGTMAATPSMTWSGRTASRPAAATSSKGRPARPAECISSQTSAIASGAFSRRPLASVPSELGGGEDAEPLFLGGGQLHRFPFLRWLWLSLLLWLRRAYPRSR